MTEEQTKQLLAGLHDYFGKIVEINSRAQDLHAQGIAIQAESLAIQRKQYKTLLMSSTPAIEAIQDLYTAASVLSEMWGSPEADAAKVDLDVALTTLQEILGSRDKALA